MAKVSKQEKQEAIERLRKWLPEGSTVYCIVRRVAASGMSRNIQLVYFQAEWPSGKQFFVPADLTISDRHPTYSAAKALGVACHTINGHDTIRVNGCGMDMCEHLVNEQLSYALYGKANAFKVRTL